MSVDATRWAWTQQKAKGTAKLVLLSLADRADENHTCYPSISRLSNDTGLDRKTVMAKIQQLESLGLIESSKQFGRFNSYRLIGVTDRHQTSAKIGTSTINGTSTKNGTRPVPKLVLEPVPKTGHKPKREPKRNLTTVRFDEFWSVYPKKVQRKDCVQKWKSKGLDAMADQLIADVQKRKRQDGQWLKGYIPNPLTYINQERWADEIQSAKPMQPVTSEEFR